MSLTLIVKENHANCPNCNKKLRVITPKTGEGSFDHYPKLEKITEGLKREIVEAYLRDPSKEYRTLDILNRMNFTRHCKGNTKRLQRSNITRAHGELVARGLINKIRKDGVHFIFRIDECKARALLK